MIVVSDASPLANLAVVGKLDLLPALYTQVLIPEAVAAELRAGEEQKSFPPFLASSHWLEVRAVADRAAVDQLLLQLDLGEAESIVLAVESRAGLLLIDEKAGRSIACRRGLRTVGLLGSLILARHREQIPAVKPILDRLIRDAGFWVRPDLYDRVLREAGE